MTDREKAIVMARTGICMLAGEKFKIFHEYIEELMGRPVQTIEMARLEDEIKNRADKDFIKLCEDPEQGRWTREEHPDAMPTFTVAWRCSVCGEDQSYGESAYCPNCGARMEDKE